MRVLQKYLNGFPVFIKCQRFSSIYKVNAECISIIFDVCEGECFSVRSELFSIPNMSC